MKKKSFRTWVWWRRASQGVFLALFVYVLWSTTYPLKGGISPEVLFRLDPLIMLMTALSERALIPGLMLSGLMIFLSLILGRFFCGWVCPLGTLIDVCGRVHQTADQVCGVPSRRGARIKYVVFAGIVLCALAGRQWAWPLDPIVTTARVVSLNLIPATTLALEKTFIFFIQTFELYGPVYDVYRGLKASVLGVQPYFFWNSLVTLLMFVLICGASFWVPRVWCRMLCPLGANYALLGRLAELRRRVDGCTQCGQCVKTCRMQAIHAGAGYSPAECVLCMDCLYDCPTQKTRFQFVFRHRSVKPKRDKGTSRRMFLQLTASFFAAAGCGMSPVASALRRPIRPPGVKDEDIFMNTCVRCGNCMKVCLTNGLQPSTLASGWQGLWTPELIPEVGYCEYQCTLCGQVCPTGAIPRLSLPDKREARMGVAEIRRKLCLPWSQKKNCLVCEEHCPVPDKAIKITRKTVNGRTVLLPVVDRQICIGCGICQNKCPVAPVRAIRVQVTKGKA